MPKYQVNADRGYPIGTDTPRYKFGETFESDSPEDAANVGRGYLNVLEEDVTPPEPEPETKPKK